MTVVDLVQKTQTHFFRPTRYDRMEYIKAELILLSAIFPSQVPVGAYKGTGHNPPPPKQALWNTPILVGSRFAWRGTSNSSFDLGQPR